MLRTHRSTRLHRALPAGLSALIALSSASSGLAQTASAEDIAAARSLGIEGTRLADSGDCTTAIGKLEAAEKLYHAPTTLDRLGECQIAVGRIVAGTESLNRVVREPLATNAPPVFAAAQKRAQKALTAAVPRIGNLKIHVDGAPDDKVSLSVDGVTVPPALLDVDRPTDPGSHEVGASAVGYKAATTTITVREGQESSVELKLEVDPNAVVAAPLSSSSPAAIAPSLAPTPSPAPAKGGPERGPAIAGFAVGGVGLVVGSVFGFLALATKSTLDSRCVGKTCPASEQSDIRSLGTQSTISTIGFGVGIVGVAVGGILLGVSHAHEGAAAAKLEPPRPQVSPWMSLGSAGVGGTFQ